MRVGGAVGRLIELPQPERGLQAETARAPISCDRDGRAIGVFGSDGMFKISLQQDVAADPVEEGVGPTLTRPPRQRHRFINMRQGCFSPLPFGFELRESAQKMRKETPKSLVGIFPPKLRASPPGRRRDHSVERAPNPG